MMKLLKYSLWLLMLRQRVVVQAMEVEERVAEMETEPGLEDEVEEIAQDGEEMTPEIFMQVYDLDGDGKISWAELDGESDGLVHDSDPQTKETNEKRELEE